MPTWRRSRPRRVPAARRPSRSTSRSTTSRASVRSADDPPSKEQTMAMPTDVGIVDLQTGFPYTSVEEKKAAYGFFRDNLKDRESLQDMEFPAQYMFKGVPDLVPEGTDVV